MLTGRIVYALCTHGIEDFESAAWEDLIPKMKAHYEATADWGNATDILSFEDRVVRAVREATGRNAELLLKKASLLRSERAAEAMALDGDQIGALDRPTAWAYICALEGVAANTDTDRRWQRASSRYAKRLDWRNILSHKKLCTCYQHGILLLFMALTAKCG